MLAPSWFWTGTVVRTRLHTSLKALAERDEPTTSEILTIEESEAAPALAAASGQLAKRYVHMRRLQLVDGQPFGVTSLSLAHEVFAKDPRGFRERPVIPVLMRLPNVRLGDAHQAMTIGAANAEVASLLQISIGATVAQTERVFKDRQDMVVYYAEIVLRGDRVRWEIHFKP
jgi:GntR family transcriptional regulator